MVYNEETANRMRKLIRRHKGITEKKMFGGLSFLLNGKMCCGLIKDDLVIRINPDEQDSILKKRDVRPMDFTGRLMKGFIYVNPSGYKTDKILYGWIKTGMNYVNTFKKSKRK